MVGRGLGALVGGLVGLQEYVHGTQKGKIHTRVRVCIEVCEDMTEKANLCV